MSTIPPPFAGTPLGSFDTTVEPVSPPVVILGDARTGSGELSSLTDRLHFVDAAVVDAFRLIAKRGLAFGKAGNSFQTIRKAVNSAPEEMKQQARALMKPFVERGWIVVHGYVTAVVDDDHGVVNVFYTNTFRAKLRRTLRFPDGTLTIAGVT